MATDHAQHERRRALVTRADLLASEAEIVSERRLSWRGRAAEMAGFGRSGGSALDRRLLIEAMASLEEEDERR